MKPQQYNIFVYLYYNIVELLYHSIIYISASYSADL